MIYIPLPAVLRNGMLHNLNSKILTINGLKLVRELTFEDVIIGPNSKHKKILELNNYSGNVFKITTINNQNLFTSNNGNIYIVSTTIKESEKKAYKPFFNISINEYLSKSNNFKHLYKIKSVENIKFTNKETTIDPYFLGVLLGDGSFIGRINVTTMDDEIVNEIYKQSKKYNLKINKTTQLNNKSSIYYFSSFINGNKINHELLNNIKELNLRKIKCDNKFVPDNYKYNSDYIRKEILAGLIDTDGSKNNNTYDFISKSKNLAKDVCFLSRSLGLRANINESIKASQSGTKGLYYRVCISGHTNIIPVRLERKKCTPRLQKKSPNKFGFTISELNSDELFREIKVCGDGLYLDENLIINAS